MPGRGIRMPIKTYACFTLHDGPRFRLGIRSRFGLGHVDANEDELLWFRLGLSLGFG